MKTKYIAYIRVSTEKQGRSGLGLTAQREIIKHNVGGENVHKWYKDVQSGKNIDILPELQKAKEHAMSEGYILIIAKTDRLRNTQQALDLVDEMTPEKVFFCNVGRNADKFTLTLFFAFAEKERLEISIRTRAALAVLKAKGVKLGAPKGWGLKREARKKRARASALKKAENNLIYNKHSLDIAVILRKKGLTYRFIADTLNKLGYSTISGGNWRATAIFNLLKRAERIYGQVLRSEE